MDSERRHYYQNSTGCVRFCTRDKVYLPIFGVQGWEGQQALANLNNCYPTSGDETFPIYLHSRLNKSTCPQMRFCVWYKCFSARWCSPL